jgi:hypothetical protein
MISTRKNLVERIDIFLNEGIWDTIKYAAKDITGINKYQNEKKFKKFVEEYLDVIDAMKDDKDKSELYDILARKIRLLYSDVGESEFPFIANYFSSMFDELDGDGDGDEFLGPLAYAVLNTRKAINITAKEFKKDHSKDFDKIYLGYKSPNNFLRGANKLNPFRLATAAIVKTMS